MGQVHLEQLTVMIGKTIAKYRVANGFTQEQIAEALGIGTEAVSRMERETLMPVSSRRAAKSS